MLQNDVLDQFKTLPPEAQRQVVDFITFLQTRYHPTVKGKTKAKLADESFVGIWRNREDMQNSNAWVRESREIEWGKTK